MIVFARCVLLLASLLSSVLALPLVARDVVAPPITYPTAGVVWHVGQTQTVTWNTTGLPVNQTNPVGMLVLGYSENNSENLNLDSPLATNLNYSVGQAQITVPNVPTRTDYIIVLFGDSGNASPEFTISNDASSSTSAVSPPATTSPSEPSPASPSTPTYTTPSVSPVATNDDSVSSPTVLAGSPTVSSGGTAKGAATAPPSSTATSHTSTVVTVTASSTPSSGQSSGAWQKHAPGLGTLSVSLTLIYFALS